MKIIKTDSLQTTFVSDSGDFTKVYHSGNQKDDFDAHKREGFIGSSILNRLVLGKYVEPVKNVYFSRGVTGVKDGPAISMGSVEGIGLEKWLQKRTTPIPDSTIRKFAFQLIAALAKCQVEYGLQHNDVYEFNLIVREITQPKTIVFGIDERDKFEIDLILGDLELTLIDWGGAMINVSEMDNNQTTKTWRAANGICLQRNMPTEEIIVPFDNDNIIRKTPQNDMFTVGHVMLTLYAHRRWKEYSYTDYTGPHVFQMGKVDEIKNAAGKGTGVGLADMSNINPGTEKYKKATVAEKAEFLTRLKTIQKKVFDDNSDFRPIQETEISKKIKAYYDKINVDGITFFDDLRDILAQNGALPFIRKMMRFNSLDRLSFGVQGTQYGLMAALYHNYFGTFRNDGSSYPININLKFEVPPIYNNNYDSRQLLELEDEYLSKYKDIYEQPPEVPTEPLPEVPPPTPTVLGKPDAKFIDFINGQFEFYGKRSGPKLDVIKAEVNLWLSVIFERARADQNLIKQLQILNMANGNKPATTEDKFAYETTPAGNVKPISAIGNAALLAYGMYVVLNNVQDVKPWQNDFNAIPDDQIIDFTKRTTMFWSPDVIPQVTPVVVDQPKQVSDKDRLVQEMENIINDYIDKFYKNKKTFTDLTSADHAQELAKLIGRTNAVLMQTDNHKAYLDKQGNVFKKSDGLRSISIGPSGKRRYVNFDGEIESKFNTDPNYINMFGDKLQSYDLYRSLMLNFYNIHGVYEYVKNGSLFDIDTGTAVNISGRTGTGKNMTWTKTPQQVLKDSKTEIGRLMNRKIGVDLSYIRNALEITERSGLSTKKIDDQYIEPLRELVSQCSEKHDFYRRLGLITPIIIQPSMQTKYYHGLSLVTHLIESDINQEPHDQEIIERLNSEWPDSEMLFKSYFQGKVVEI